MEEPTPLTHATSQQPGYYAMRIRGHLDARWSDWFDGWEVSLTESGETILSGPIADQAALLGLLTRVHDLGLTLIAVYRIDRP